MPEPRIADEAACAYDVANVLTINNGKSNFPHLFFTTPRMPSHLRLDSEKDTEEIKDFVRKQARLAAAKNYGVIACVRTHPTPNEEIKNVETKPEVETAATQGRQQDTLAQAPYVKAEGLTEELHRGGAGEAGEVYEFSVLMGDILPLPPLPSRLHLDLAEGCEGRVEKKQASLAACQAKEFRNEGGISNPKSTKVPARLQSFRGSQDCSRAGSGRKFSGVRTRKGVRGYLVEIRPPKWKKTIWLGAYNTAEEAACAYDAGAFLIGKNRKYNFPDLIATIPPLPSHLRLDSEKDTEEIKDFMQKQARLAAHRAAKNNGMKACATRPTANEEIKNVETKPEVETAATQGRQQDAEVELEDVKANVIGGFKMDQSLNGEARAAKPDHQSDNHGSSSWVLQESKAEVTADSPCRETDSRERSRDPIDEETLISRLAPFIGKAVEEALNGTLLPLVSALRSREEEELKHRDKMLALEVQKLALKREKLLFKRRRLTRSQPQRRSSAAMARSAPSRNGLQVKKNRPPQ